MDPGAARIGGYSPYCRWLACRRSASGCHSLVLECGKVMQERIPAEVLRCWDGLRSVAMTIMASRTPSVHL
jgi:hypothetical protein